LLLKKKLKHVTGALNKVENSCEVIYANELFNGHYRFIFFGSPARIFANCADARIYIDLEWGFLFVQSRHSTIQQSLAAHWTHVPSQELINCRLFHSKPRD